jgi:hypothetical protein
MRYVLLFAGDQSDFNSMTPADLQTMYGQIGEWWDRHSAAGVITGGQQLQPPNTATTVRHGSGFPTVTDGPYVESKEQIGGFAVVEVDNLDQALDLAKTWPAQGTVEVRPAVEMRMPVPN